MPVGTYHNHNIVFVYHLSDLQLRLFWQIRGQIHLATSSRFGIYRTEPVSVVQKEIENISTVPLMTKIFTGKF
jgi:hypothetical protein